MAREIKFRAWDKTSKIMVKDSDAKNYLADGVKNIEFMQFTGIKDKKGKEIYEGDIVKIKDDSIWEPICDCEEKKMTLNKDFLSDGCVFDVANNKRYTAGVVAFEYGEFVFTHDDEDCSMNMFAHLGDGTSKKYPQSRHPLFEVVGNIYENPELTDKNI